MIDPAESVRLADPASIFIGLGAVAAILSAPYWVQVGTGWAKLADTDGRAVRRSLGRAALLTGIALALTGAGYLFGRFTGQF